MPRTVIALGLGVGLVVAVGILLLGRGEPVQDSTNDASAERRRESGKTGRPTPERDVAPLPPPDSTPAPDPEAAAVAAAWARAEALLEEGHPLEALAALRPLRETAPGSFEAPGRAELVERIELAAVAAVDGALQAGKTLRAAEQLALLEGLVVDPARLGLLRERIAGAGRQFDGDRARAERRIVARARNPADRTALERHVRRFGGRSRQSARGKRPVAVDALLEQVEKRADAEVEALPIPDPDEVEKRRIEQLEKLRQRGAVLLLDHIAAGLAWLALHQGEDGRITDKTAIARCRELKHKPQCVKSGNERYPVAATALSVLAFLDFRDQDVHGLFEPALAAGINRLLAQQNEDGSFPAPRGYSNGIAIMALGQAAAASGREDVRAAVERGLAWFAAHPGPQGGFRYKPGDPGDLSVVGWVVQAVEAAGTAKIEAPGTLVEGLRGFWRWTWLGESRFSYVARGPERSSLAPVGMLAGTILGDPSIGEPTRTAWRRTLGSSRRRPRLYTLYYGVRVLLAMDGKLPKAWNDWVLDLAKAQVAKGSAAGSFPHGRWSLRDRDTTIRTAFSVLTLEHSLYRR